MDELTTSNLLIKETRNSTFYPLFSSNPTLNESYGMGEEYAKLYEAPAEVVAILSIFYGGISIIAIIGNTLVIWIVATTRQMHTVTNLYIANLAFADVIIGMFCIPFQFQAALLQKWTLPEFMCAFCPFVQVLSVNVSVFTLTAIAVDRHRAIINPLRARPTRFVSKLVIVAIWVAAVAFSIPIAIAFRVIEITEIHRGEDGIIKNVTRLFCENVNLTEDQLQTYRYYLVFVQYVVPLFVISFIYIQMAIKLWGSRTPGNAQDSRDITLLRNKKKVIKMLIIVVVVFGVCWLPLQTYNILYVTWPHINEYRFINIIWFCCDWLAMSNSCYNPFIYGIYNEKFKREFNRRFSVCFCKFADQDIPDRTLSIYTRATSIRSNYTGNSTRYRSNLFVQNQKRASMSKSPDGYSTINDVNNSKHSVKNNRSITGDNYENKSQYTRITDPTEYNHHQHPQHYYPVGQIPEGNICTTQNGNEWDHERVCDSLCMAEDVQAKEQTQPPYMETNFSSNLSENNRKDDDEVGMDGSVFRKTGSEKGIMSTFKQSGNFNRTGLTGRKVDSKYYIKTGNTEMTECRLLNCRDERNQSSHGVKFNVKFNNF